MKILLISSGAGAWPNDGWGAVENLVADFSWALRESGAEVEVYHREEFGASLEDKIAAFLPDMIHCEYDDHIIHLVPTLQKYPTMKILLTTHYAYLSQPYKLVQDGYMGRFLFACDLAIRTNLCLAVLSEEIAKTYETLGGVPRDKIWVFPNGTRADQIQVREPVYKDRAVCVGKIEIRKNQSTLQACKKIDFVGPIADTDFVKDENYKGTWTRKDLYAKLTDYPCLVLMSDGEAHPLVVGEGLAAGCAILCNEIAAANLPRDKPWIRVLSSTNYTVDELNKHVSEMSAIGCKSRAEIREWACKSLDWRLRAKTYLNKWFSESGSDDTRKNAIVGALRFALVGPGIMPIPPPGWGAVEQLIWDYNLALTEKGHHVDIINTPNRDEIVAKVKEGKYDVVHIHYDVFAELAEQMDNKCILLTSHYPYIDKLEKWAADGFDKTFMKMCVLAQKPNVHIFAVSSKDKMTFETMGGIRGNAYLMLNGVNVDKFTFKETPHFPNRSVVLAKVEPRKRQHLTYWFDDVDYIGRGDFRHPNFRGELGHDVLYRMLTDFGNMVLLSDGENGTPIAVKEGLAAGLGCVLSKAAAFEFKDSLPWITVVPEEDLANMTILRSHINRNREVTQRMRKEIREWTKKHWDWSVLLDQYVSNVKSILEKCS
jgi:glycosyltransferase involved in cell wall biosynthesis